MADGTDTAGARRDFGHFVEGSAFAEFLEAPKIDYLKTCLPNRRILVKKDGYFGVAFNASDGGYDKFFHDKRYPYLALPSIWGLRPASSSVST